MRQERFGSSSWFGILLGCSAIAHATTLALVWTWSPAASTALSPLSVNLIANSSALLAEQHRSGATEPSPSRELAAESGPLQTVGSGPERSSPAGIEPPDSPNTVDESQLPSPTATTASSAMPSPLPTPVDLIQAITSADRHSGFSEHSPRVRRIAEGDSLSAAERFYLEAWTRRVTRIGQLNYPSAAVAGGAYGTLQIIAIVESDGSLSDVRILESSGHEVLDGAATRIVKLAAPFAPFPPSLRSRYDRLEIVRGWEFRKRDSHPDV